MTLGLATPAANAVVLEAAMASKASTRVMCWIFMIAASSNGCLPTETGADADRTVLAADRTADGQRRAIADRPLVTDRQRGFAPLRTHADADAVRRAHARGTHRHVEHRGAHRTL